MKTTKSYLAGLGMTGIVIASVLSLLVLGTGLVAFDGVPESGSSRDRLERVVVDDETLGSSARAAGSAESSGRGRNRPLESANRYLAASRALAAQWSPGASHGDYAAEKRTARRRSIGHGGAQVRVGGALGGGASAESGTTGATGTPPRRSRGPAGGPRGLGQGSRGGGGAAPGRDSGGGSSDGGNGAGAPGEAPGLPAGEPPVPPADKQVAGGVRGPAADRVTPVGLLP